MAAGLVCHAICTSAISKMLFNVCLLILTTFMGDFLSWHFDVITSFYFNLDGFYSYVEQQYLSLP